MPVQFVVGRPCDRRLEYLRGRSLALRTAPSAAVEVECGVGLCASEAEVAREIPLVSRRRVGREFAEDVRDVVLREPLDVFLAQRSDPALPDELDCLTQSSPTWLRSRRVGRSGRAFGRQRRLPVPGGQGRSSTGSPAGPLPTAYDAGVSVSLPWVQPWSPSRRAVRQVRGATLKTCTPVAVVVGSVLSVVNKGDIVDSGMADGRVVVKVVMNLLIPFLSSSTGALLTLRTRPEPAALGEVSSQ